MHEIYQQALPSIAADIFGKGMRGQYPTHGIVISYFKNLWFTTLAVLNVDNCRSIGSGLQILATSTGWWEKQSSILHLLRAKSVKPLSFREALPRRHMVENPGLANPSIAIILKEQKSTNEENCWYQSDTSKAMRLRRLLFTGGLASSACSWACRQKGQIRKTMLFSETFDLLHWRSWT